MSTSEAQSSFEFEVTLRVMGETLSTDRISRSLGIDPDHWHDRGAIPISKAGRKVRPYPESLWSRSWRGVGALEAESTLQSIADTLLKRLDSLRTLKEGGFRVDLMIGIFSSDDSLGFTLSSPALSAVAELNIDLHIDVYFTGS